MAMKSDDVTNQLATRLEAAENETPSPAGLGGTVQSYSSDCSLSGFLVFSGNNTYTGGTTTSSDALPSNTTQNQNVVVTSGQLTIQRNQLVSNSGSLLIQAGGKVVVQDTSGDVTYAGPLTTSFEALRNAAPAGGAGGTLDNPGTPAAVQAVATGPAEEKKSSFRA